MSRREKQPVTRQRSRRLVWWAGGATLAVVALALGVASWSRHQPRDLGSGRGRVVVDRTEIDLGALRFNTPASAAFVVRNAGDGALEIEGAPTVRAVMGC